jgi:amidophosphoribosyltransferase
MKLIPNRHLLNGKRILFCDDSIIRGTQLKDNVDILYGYGAKEVHIRIGSPPIIYTCPYLNFSASKSDLELVTRQIIRELEGEDDIDLEEYAKPGSDKYCRMVECIRAKFNMSSLKYNTLDVLIKAIGLPKEKVCTHCFDASSHF